VNLVDQTYDSVTNGSMLVTEEFAKSQFDSKHVEFNSSFVEEETRVTEDTEPHQQAQQESTHDDGDDDDDDDDDDNGGDEVDDGGNGEVHDASLGEK
jgi:hypothetical protein